MIKLCLSFLVLFLVGGGFGTYLLKSKNHYIKEQDRKILKLKKELLSLKNSCEIKEFENSIYNRKRFLERKSDEEDNFNFDDDNSTIIF